MKKFYVMGMVLALAASFAFASSISVPWFTDAAGPNCKMPPITPGNVSQVYLHNTQSTDIECSIAYYNANGDALAFDDGQQSTFAIKANATIAFRPGCADPNSAGGMETPEAVAVPDRPTTDGKKNGSIVINWAGTNTGAVQGMIVTTQHVGQQGTSTTNVGKMLQYGTLLPAGV